MMSDQRTPPAVNAHRTDVAGSGQWRNQGSAMPDAVHAVIAPRAMSDEAAVGAPATALDARQDEIMTATSCDGQPPPRRLRILEWRFLVLAGIPVIAGSVAWIIIKGVNWIAVAAAIAYGVMLLVGLSPVVAAALQRGREERTARRLARFELEHGPPVVIRAEQMALDEVTPA